MFCVQFHCARTKGPLLASRKRNQVNISQQWTNRTCKCSGGRLWGVSTCAPSPFPFFLSGPLQSVIPASETPCSISCRAETYSFLLYSLFASLHPLWFEISFLTGNQHRGPLNMEPRVCEFHTTTLQIVCCLMYQHPWSFEETPQLQPGSLVRLRNAPTMRYINGNFPGVMLLNQKGTLAPIYLCTTPTLELTDFLSQVTESVSAQVSFLPARVLPSTICCQRHCWVLLDSSFLPTRWRRWAPQRVYF